MSDYARRGKFAEGKVRDFLKQWAEKHSSFCYNRINDAHSASGALSNPQPGDFQWFLRCGSISRNGLIEVKEVSHAFRLPYGSFGSDQVARMRIRQMAGSEPLVLICHRVAGKTLWRAPDFALFQTRDPERPSGSWDFSSLPSHSKVSEVMEEYLK